MTSDTDQQREWNKKLHGRCRPEPTSNRRTISSEAAGEKRHESRKESGLPHVVRHGGQIFRNHFDLSFCDNFRSACSASLMSSSVKSPDFTRRAITGRVPNKLKSSSIS